MYGRPESVALAEEAYRLLSEQPPGPELALVYARLAQEVNNTGRVREAEAWAEQGLPLLERFGLDDWALRTRALIVSVEELRELAREALDPKRGYGTWAVTSTLNILAYRELWLGAGPAAAADALRTAAELAGRRGLERPARWYQGNLAEPLYDLGRWDDVLRITGEIRAWEAVGGESSIGTFAPPFAVQILVARGELAAAVAALDELLDRSRDGETLINPSAPIAAAAVATARGESELAVASVVELENLATSLGLEDVLGYLPSIGRVCSAAGDLGPLQRLLGDANGLERPLHRFVAGAQAILAEARGEHAVAEPLYDEARKGFEEYGCVVEHAYALLGLARCRLACERVEDAVRPLEEARAIFERLGARLLVDETDGLLAKTATPSA